MNLAGALLCVALFAICLHRTRIVPNTGAVLTHGKSAYRIMRDNSLDDDTKEKAIQQGSLQLFRLLGKLIAASAVSIGAPLLAVWLLSKTGLAEPERILAILLDPYFIAGTLIVAYAGYRLMPR